MGGESYLPCGGEFCLPCYGEKYLPKGGKKCLPFTLVAIFQKYMDILLNCFDYNSCSHSLCFDFKFFAYSDLYHKAREVKITELTNKPLYSFFPFKSPGVSA